MTISPLSISEPAPWFSVAANGNVGTVALDELAGRYLALFVFKSAAQPGVSKVIAALAEHGELLDNDRALLLAVSNDQTDFEQARLPNRTGLLSLWDKTGIVANRYGAAGVAAEGPIHPTMYILSPALQVIDVIALTEPGALVDRVARTLELRLARSTDVYDAPTLVVPEIFDSTFRRHLIDLYEASGGREIGLIENHGNIIKRSDTQFRKRLDYYINDEAALTRTRDLLGRRLLPLVYRAFQFNVTRIERYLVGCYDAQSGGFFRPHRDNTAPASAHRRFAVTINLNDDYDGGDLRFPEFGPRLYRPAPGSAVVFSCSLLHEVTPVTRGRRYAFLSFFYDEPSQRVRDEYARRAAGSATGS